MPRAVEEIPLDEELYRRARAEHVDGDHLMPDAIELPASSVNRSKYSQPKDVTTADRPVAAKTTPQQFPPPATSPGNVQYEFRAEDVPEEGDAHAEIRLRRVGMDYDPRHKPNSSAFKGELRARLAAVFRVVPL
jgi:hypothetical protein